MCGEELMSGPPAAYARRHFRYDVDLFIDVQQSNATAVCRFLSQNRAPAGRHSLQD